MSVLKKQFIWVEINKKKKKIKIHSHHSKRSGFLKRLHSLSVTFSLGYILSLFFLRPYYYSISHPNSKIHETAFSWENPFSFSRENQSPFLARGFLDQSNSPFVHTHIVYYIGKFLIFVFLGSSKSCSLSEESVTT